MKEDIKRILEFQKKRDWLQFHLPKNLAISLSLEAGKVLELFQWTEDNRLPDNKKQELAEELADVYYYLLLLANETGIDVIAAFDDKMRISEERYPISKSKGCSQKYTKLK
jgi:NTP pyrophosphatase (non-canonical NTP hydrolase)